MKKFNITIALIISLITLSFSIMFIFNPKKEFSENEFRYLQKTPEFSFDKLLNGKFITSVENYTTDHFVYRDFWVQLKTKVYMTINQKLINDVYIADDGYLINRFYKPQNSDKIINILNNFYAKNKDINIQMMLVPTASSVYSDKLPKDNINYNEIDVINYYQDNLNFELINIYNELINFKNDYQLYYKTDHHWTSYGAYVAYKAYLNNNNINNSYDLKDFTIKEVNNEFLGTLYSKVFVYKNKDSIVTINLDNTDFTIKHQNRTTNSFYENKYLETKDKYSYFLGQNEALIEITNNNYKGDNILIIKDSYANSLIPMLANHYQNIYVIDPRYYNLKISDFIKDNNINNVLILYNVNTIDTDTGITNIR